MSQRNYAPKHRREQSGRTFNGRKAIEMLYHTPSWKQYRIKFLSFNPLCYCCGVKATVVDHLTPHQGDIKLFEKTDNHIPLCESCHNRVTAMFDRRHRAGNSITPKITWFVKNRMEKNISFRIKVMPSYL